jgi:hypothetical protein
MAPRCANGAGVVMEIAIEIAHRKALIFCPIMSTALTNNLENKDSKPQTQFGAICLPLRVYYPLKDTGICRLPL